MPPTEHENEEIEKLLEENLELAKENNKLLKEMRRNAIIGLVARVVVFLVLLGVPLFFISTYLGPLLESFSNTANGQTLPSGLFGIPSEQQIQQLIEEYRKGLE